jgi:C-terminal processing protease CtpA/Prc
MAKENQQLSDSQKIYALSTLWSEAKTNFAHFEFIPEINWDKTYQNFIPKVLATKNTKEFNLVLKKFYAILKQHHTFVITPSKMNGKIDEPQIEIKNINRQAIISNVSEHYKDIPIGSRVVSVQGVEINKYLKENKFPYISYSTEPFLWEQAITGLLKGDKGTKVKIKIKTPTGKTIEKSLHRNKSTSKEKWIREPRKREPFSFNMLDNNIAYVALRTFGTREVTKQFKQKLSEIKKCNALLIDLRYNGGGDSDNGFDIVSHLTKDVLSADSWKSRELKSFYKALGRWRSDLSADAINKLPQEDKNYINHYKGTAFFEGKNDSVVPVKDLEKRIIVPTVVLMKNNGSAAEDFLIAMGQLENVTLIGERSAGCTGTPYIFDIPTGGIAFVTTTVQYDTEGNLSRNGVKPDLELKQTVEDIINNRDVVLEKGISILKLNSPNK